MGQLQDLFEKILREQGMEIAVERICGKLAAIGLQPSPRQRRRIRRALMDGEPLSLRFWSWPPWRSAHLELTVTDEDLAAIQKEHEVLLGGIEGAVPAFVQEYESQFRDVVLAKHTRDLEADHRDLRGFRERLAARWRRPLTLLELIIDLSERIAVESAPTGVPRLSHGAALEPVLRRLHGRGVRVAKEALVLLQSGYADGAMARWRTLHELTVTALFVQTHGEDCARTYLEHEAVENYRAASQYRRAHEKLGYDPISDEEWQSLETAFRSALDKHGKPFDADYGWARRFMSGRAQNFAELEQSISLAHLRPFYKMASQQVHAGAKGILFGLSHDPAEVVLLGPSNNGLADPGQSVGLTLSLLTTIFLTLTPSIDIMVGVKVQAALADEAAVVWVDTQTQLEREEAELRDGPT